MSEKTWLNNDYNDYVNVGGGGGNVADWDPSLVRYIFLDGDNGDDSHLGYLDAPPGTVFSPADAAAVAVKTTHRINQIRPPVGAGRMVVVLLKPRAGGALYDAVTPGDHAGTEDRSRINGYSYMLTRGSSDHTNSRLDKTNLGYGPAIAGPNTDGSFTVANAVDNGDGTTVLTLTGATLPAGYVVARYRLRTNKVLYSTVVAYAAIRWNELAATPDPTKLTIWNGGVTYSPGDKVWIEKPTVALAGFSEAAGAQSRNQQADLVTAGLHVANPGYSPVYLGSNDAFRVQYSHTNFEDGSPVFVYSNDGDVQFVPGWIDETGNQSPGAVTGVGFPSFTQLRGLRNDFTLQACAYGWTNQPTDDPFFLFAHGRDVNIFQSTIQSYHLECEGGISGLTDCLVGNGEVLNEGEVSISNVLRVPFWTGRSTPLRAGVNQGATLYNLGKSKSAWPFGEAPEPDQAGYDVHGAAARFTVRIDLDQPQPGTRVDFLPTEAVVIPLPYTQNWGLGSTGFELETGVKLIVHKSIYTAPEVPTPFAGDELPCPVCRLMQFRDSEGVEPVETPIGIIVCPSTGQENRVEVWGLAPPLGLLSPVGVTVTPSISTDAGQGGGQIGGFVLVAFKGPLVMQLAPASPYPEPNANLYAATDFPGYAADIPPDPRDPTSNVAGPRFIGRVMPSGWPGAGGQTVYATWEPDSQGSQVAGQDPTGTYSKNNATLGDVPGAFVRLRGNHVYDVEATLFLGLGGATAGGKVALGGTVTPGTGTVVLHEAWDLGAATPTPLLTQYTTNLNDSGAVNYAGAASVVAWKIKAVVRAAADGDLQLRFAQHATDADNPSAVITSLLRATEQN